MEDVNERRKAELEFVSAAYNEEEAWVCDSSSSSGTDGRGDESLSSLLPKVQRRVSLPDMESCDTFVSLLLSLSLPPGYPIHEALEISATVEEYRSKCSPYLSKLAYNALPQLVKSCRQLSDSMIGEESVFAVLNEVDEWVRERWPEVCRDVPQTQQQQQQHPCSNSTSRSGPDPSSSSPVVLGRRLLYSHHIIGKKKRSTMKQMASHYNLTGYVKIGWPGIIIIEGREEYCLAFCDEVQRWAWRYLVIRGEQQESIHPAHQDFNSKRCFTEFLEVSDMSLVANHCREVGLEALFRTSMKQYNTTAVQDDDTTATTPYGTLVHVDHMNDSKGYRKWLRKTGYDTETMIMIKQCYPHHDFTKRPTILVAIVGDQQSVTAFLKRWRTSRVDVDSRGRPCIERQMKILSEGILPISPSLTMDWDQAQAEDSVNVTSDQLIDWVQNIGGKQWTHVLAASLSIRKGDTNPSE